MGVLEGTLYEWRREEGGDRSGILLCWSFFLLRSSWGFVVGFYGVVWLGGVWGDREFGDCGLIQETETGQTRKKASA